MNLDAQGRVLNAGDKFYDPPRDSTRTPAIGSLRNAARLALRTVDPDLNVDGLTEVAPKSSTPHRANRSYHFAAGPAQKAEAEGQPVWFPVRGRLEPAWLVYATAESIETEEVVVSAEADRVFHRDPMTWHQTPRGLVYRDRSPQPTPQPGAKLEAEPPCLPRQVPLVGDPHRWRRRGGDALRPAAAGSLHCIGLKASSTPGRSRTAYTALACDSSTTAAPPWWFPALPTAAATSLSKIDRTGCTGSVLRGTGCRSSFTLGLLTSARRS